MLPPRSSRSSCDAWQSWSGAWPVSARTRREALRLLRDLDASGSSADELRAAVARRLLDLDSGLIGGLAAYRRHEPRPERPEHPVLWQEGASRLLDHAPPGQDQAAGPTLLFVPSLVNRAWVLDLMPGHSILAWLAEQGARPLLLDWGYPGATERGMDLTGFIAGRLERALAALPGPVVLVGYCMGGLLALAAALRRPDRVRALALLATPWDFHAGEQAGRATSLAALLPVLEPMLATTGTLPVEVIQALFAQLDPFGVARKFRA
ncbi:alpha/beta fold hydrolase, partial [Roseomonas sp. DSM 102946]|nr:alpha/beta fold hydrolase [Roseomonas sp. DSM 102946]